MTKPRVVEPNGVPTSEPMTPEPEQRDRFGCTAHEAAELNAFRRVLLEGRVSPEEAIWQWCTGEDALDIRPEQLRKMWDFMVDAASVCSEVEHHATFLNVISVLYDVCSNHNISVKQGKKVKARLEKVGPLRQQLVVSIRPPIDEDQLDSVLDAVRSVELMLDKQLLERARAVQKTLQEGGPAADALRAPEPSEPESEESLAETPCAAAEAPPPLYTTPAHAAAAAVQQQLNLAEAVPPPPPPPPRGQAPYAGADTSRGASQAAAMVGHHPPRLQSGHAAPVPPPPGMHMHASARPAGMQPLRMPMAGGPAPSPPRGSPQPNMDASSSRTSGPAPHPPAPAQPQALSPANPFSGTSSHMADPMMDLLGSDLVGAMDSASSGITVGDIGQRGAHSGWPPSSGPPMPGAPMQQRGSPVQLPAQVRMPQHGSPGMRPFGSSANGMFRINPPANGAVSRPLPPGPPPVPPPAPGVMDGYGGPKPPGMQRNGMKVHHSPGQHQPQPYGASYGSNMHVFDSKPEPPTHQAAHSSSFVAMSQQQQQHRMAGEVNGRYKEQGLRFGQLSTRAPPFMPASKGSSSPQLPAAPMGRSMEMHAHMFPKAGGGSVDGHHRSVGTLPIPGSEHKYMRELPSDPFGLDGPLPSGNEVHHHHHLRRDLTSDAVTSVLEGHAVRPKHDLAFASGSVPSSIQGQAAVQSEEVLNWLGNDILDALDGTSS